MSKIESKDIDPDETKEWLEAFDAVCYFENTERAQYLLSQLNQHAKKQGISGSTELNTPYLNTIPTDQQADMPDDGVMMETLANYMRWNALTMVMRAGIRSPGIGGHIATYASSALLFEIGFTYFFKARNSDHPGDLVFFQGHSSPGIYARAYMEGRLTKKQLNNFRSEAFTDGLSSYPHPWLMPDFWQFTTVSMGLGMLQAIYQAQFLKYLEHRSLIDNKDRKVWIFCGDGEMDETESLGSLRTAGRERLDNLIVVVSCNLQRLDGPVFGNGQIVQELERIYHGASWNVIKVIWNEAWEPLFAKDTQGLLLKRLDELVDGEYQTCCAKGPAYMREHLFGKSPELLELVSDMSDEDLSQLQEGGFDVKKLYAAYEAAVNHKGQPTVILAHTVKGFGLGASGHALNTAHNAKKVELEDRLKLRDYFNLPLTDKQVESLEYLKPKKGSPEHTYLHAQREKLGGYYPHRDPSCDKLVVPSLDVFKAQLEGTGEREVSTTMQYVRILATLLKDKNLKNHIVPIVADETRTFGMEGLFRQIGIYSPFGQLYEPEDKSSLMNYSEKIDGQLLQQGINEQGAMASWIAAATSYSSSQLPMIPCYIYYSMFGYQRVGDLIWAAGDMRARGFILGGTAGRTTLSGEGLQHQDGQNILMFGVVPNCVSYDPTFSYELAVIMQHGLEQMYANQEDVFYYITMMNENYQHPPMPKGVEKDIIKGMYLFKESDVASEHTVQLLGSGAIFREVIQAADMLEKEYKVAADIWGVPGLNELRRDIESVARANRLHPEKKAGMSHVAKCFKGQVGPFIAATDYVKMYADQIRSDVPGPYYVLGTDGFGRSDDRENLRAFFEVDARMIVYTALKALFDQGHYSSEKLKQAKDKLAIDAARPDPVRS